MSDRIRFVSPLVCPRREGQLVRPQLRQRLKPLSQSQSPLKRTEELVDVDRFEANLESVSTDFSYERGVSTPGGPCHKPIRILYQYPNPRLLQEIGNLIILIQSQRHKILTVNHTIRLPKRPPINILHHRLLAILLYPTISSPSCSQRLRHNIAIKFHNLCSTDNCLFLCDLSDAVPFSCGKNTRALCRLIQSIR